MSSQVALQKVRLEDDQGPRIRSETQTLWSTFPGGLGLELRGAAARAAVFSTFEVETGEVALPKAQLCFGVVEISLVDLGVVAEGVADLEHVEGQGRD